MSSNAPSKRIISFRAGEDSFWVGDIVEVEADGEEVRAVIAVLCNMLSLLEHVQLPFVAELLSKSKKRKNYGDVVRVRWYYRKDGA